MLRVRQALDIPTVRKNLRTKIPKECFNIPKDLSNARAVQPSTLMKHFPQESRYITLGFLTEDLLRYPSKEITPALIKNLAKSKGAIDLPDDSLTLKTTNNYIASIKATRVKLIIQRPTGQTFEYDTVVKGTYIEGHPDIRTSTDIFEVKASGRINEYWPEFLMQVFAYAALDSNAERVHLVFPLQNYIWTYNLKGWTHSNRREYRQILEEAARASLTPSSSATSTMIPSTNTIDLLTAQIIMQKYSIGSHIAKQKTLPLTIQSILTNAPDPTAPYQIFLSSPTSYHIKEIPAIDIELTRTLIRENGINLFIHAPYTINLCDASALSTFLPCLKRHLEVGSAIGAKGVVVHVGKSCKQHPETARNNMKIAIHEAIKTAPTCPLLLETPAGQGTEMLTTKEDFVEFCQEVIAEFDPTEVNTFGMCIDTCHVFSAGINPLTYLEYVLSDDKKRSLLKLIHYNDSKGDCGACVDRHALICTGKIPCDTLIDCANMAFTYNIPMLTE